MHASKDSMWWDKKKIFGTKQALLVSEKFIFSFFSHFSSPTRSSLFLVTTSFFSRCRHFFSPMSAQVAEGGALGWTSRSRPHMRVAEQDHGKVAATNAGWWDGGATGRGRGGSHQPQRARERANHPSGSHCSQHEGGRRGSYHAIHLIGGDPTPPLFEGRRGVFWWPPKIGEAIGRLLEQEKSSIFPNMTVLWGWGVVLEDCWRCSNLLGFGRKWTNFSPCMKELDPISCKLQSKESSEFRVPLPQKYIIMMNFSSVAKTKKTLICCYMLATT